MSVYKRGGVWWFKFRFEGQVIRESAKTVSKSLAREAERARRRELETAINGVQRRARMPLFSIAAREWLRTKETLSAKSVERFEHLVTTLCQEFGGRLVCDIGAEDIAALQRKRSAAGRAGRTVNYEVGVLRQILKARGLWGALSDRVKSLRERHDAGRSISREDESKIVLAISSCRSPAMLPLFILAVDTGLRTSEIRSLRRKDLTLEWSNGVIVAGHLTVPQSKTEAGTGRMVPLTRRVCGALTIWLSRFSEAVPDSYVFPRHKVGLSGKDREPMVWAVNLGEPIGEWKKTWQRTRRLADLDYRWHDMRHTFITRLAENPNVSEETIRALAGHVSRRMLERYSHIRTRAKQDAIRTLEQHDFGHDGAQNWAQSATVEKPQLAN
jgi:integrase